MSKTHLSIIIPVFNESESVPLLLSELMQEVDKWLHVDYEVIVIDDGSEDDTVEAVENVKFDHDRIKLIRLNRNFGQTAALAAGIDASVGEIIVTMDGDGQNDPRDIPRLIQGVYHGSDCVSGWRRQRNDNTFLRVLPSMVANFLIRQISKIPIHDFGCSLKAYNGELLRSIPLYGDMHRLVPFYVYQNGGRITEVVVNHRPRVYGKSKYGLRRVFRVIQDVLVARVNSQFLLRPMHLFGNLSLLLWVTSFGLLLVATLMKVADLRDFTESPLLLVSGILFLTGLQLASTGLVAEMILRKLSYTRGNPVYLVSQRVPKRAHNSDKDQM
jgi:glycosyltransferase involved in cell wall biosynthesis